MDPVKIWGGPVHNSLSQTFRRIGVSSGSDQKITITALGSASLGSDLVIILDIVDGKVDSKNEIPLPGRNGNLVEDSPFTWQDLTGQLFTSKHITHRFSWLIDIYI